MLFRAERCVQERETDFELSLDQISIKAKKKSLGVQGNNNACVNILII
jgi:hypothetical protein